MTIETILFYILAVIVGASAIGVVVTQNIVRSATWLLFTLLGTAGLYFLLGADFVGATQILVYVGGTLVLVIFGVMLTAQGPFVSMKISAAEWLIGMSVGLLLYGVLSVSFWRIQPEPAYYAKKADLEEKGKPFKVGSSVVLGESLLGIVEATPEAEITGLHGTEGHEGHDADHKHAHDHKHGHDHDHDSHGEHKRRRLAYLLPFEIVSVHLLVGLIGAAYLARAKRHRKTNVPTENPPSA